ncbi:MAG: ATP-binding protein [archaeon GB-1867-097]|nr:ATP-binding protein [Candidatus Culexmicrobium thermophilum]MCS7384961.1 ATP-binding protein [Candidatus Culexmicrobium thermophilum]
MLFDVRPKISEEDLFNRERELNMILEALRLGEGIILVTGIRRIGKSSVLNVALKKSNLPYVIIDVRKIFFEYGNVIHRRALFNAIADSFTRNMKFFEKIKFKVKDVIGRIKGFYVSEVGVEVEPNINSKLTDILAAIDEWCLKNDFRFIVAFDEAQYLRFAGGVKYDGIFAWVADNLRNISIIFTGSEIGVLRDFLKFDDPSAPLYGRYYREVVLNRFDRETSIQFLKKGFEELRMEVDGEELEEVVDKLDGIVGWLTFYGYCRGIQGLSHRRALNETFEKCSRLVLEELQKIIEPSRRRYGAILKAVSLGYTKWSDIKDYVTIKVGSITDRRFSMLLNKLVKYSYLIKENGRYEIPDPIVKYVLREKFQI